MLRATHDWARCVRLFAFAVSALGLATSAHALTFGFTLLANDATQIPSGAGTFAGYGAPALEGARVGFVGVDANGNQGVYVGPSGGSGSFTAVTNTTTPIPGGTGAFGNGYGSPSLSGSNLAFFASASNGQSGAYTDASGSLAAAADFNTAIPGGSGNFQQIRGVEIAGGDLSFFGAAAPLGLADSGIYRASAGTLVTVADTTTPIPGDGRPFTSFRFATALNASSTAFIGLGFGSQAVYLSDGSSLSIVVDESDAVPGGTGNFDGFLDITLDGTDVAFLGLAPGQGGYYTNIGGVLSAVADTNTPIPDGSGLFLSFGAISFDDGAVAFLGLDSNGDAGIYTDFRGVLEKVIDVSDMLDGRALADLRLSNEALEGSRLAFQATFTDGTNGLYLATIPEPSTAALLGVGIVCLAAARRQQGRSQRR